MDIKKLLFFLPALLFAEYSFKVSQEKFATYKEQRTSRSQNAHTFLREGVQMKTDGKMIVSFKQPMAIKQFETSYGVKMVAKISQTRESYIFTTSNSLGATCEKIGKDDRVRFAFPNWKDRKELY